VCGVVIGWRLLGSDGWREGDCRVVLIIELPADTEQVMIVVCSIFWFVWWSVGMMRLC